MRVFFCTVPALFVFGAAFFIGVWLIGADAKQALYVSCFFGAAMFVFGWQVTDPEREMHREQQAQRSQAQEGQHATE